MIGESISFTDDPRAINIQQSICIICIIGLLAKDVTEQYGVIPTNESIPHYYSYPIATDPFLLTIAPPP